ncbi:prepilin-type N-terminal cleavage/methylation domain-containing protein [Diaminobutyricibacter sp. McL0608]|uniref:prepilin-type N-terminal cleavage/methylation domain-containing protein n=1 Tax=Leifsonia sp. McL0608 TaxID=3143537 RepID=UPI0031F324FF
MNARTTIRTIRQRLQRGAAGDTGMTLIEVLVAMMVFAIIAMAVAYSLTLTLVMTRDSRAREVAANLAAQQIDVVRSLQNVFSVNNGSTTQTVDGITYTVTQTTDWVSNTGTVATCGSTGSLLQNKLVNVSVKWSGMDVATPAVQANTLLAPSGPLNDQSSGTILVRVSGSTNISQPSIAVAAGPDSSVPGNTATAVNPAPTATDSDGCSYILKVVPGSYKITIGTSGDGMINEKQQTTPSKTVPIAAGNSVLQSFTYDKAGSITSTFASNSGTSGILFPSNMYASFVSTGGDPYSAPVTVASKKATTSLFPFPSGYQVFAGTYVAGTPGTAPTCLSVDPGAWTTPNASGHVGARGNFSATKPGGPAGTASVPMGVFTVKAPTTGRFLTAISATAGATVGDPGCATPMAYTFTTKTTGADMNLALPYGSWTLYWATTSTTTPPLSQTIAVSTLNLPSGSALTGTTVFTLDARAP